MEDDKENKSSGISTKILYIKAKKDYKGSTNVLSKNIKGS